MGGKILFSGIPNKGEQNEKSSPTKGIKIRSGCLLGAQKSAEMLHHPCILGDPQHRGKKSEVAASPLPSRGPKRGRKCYITRAFSGVPKQGDKVKGGPQVGGSAMQPLRSRWSAKSSSKVARAGLLEKIP